MIRTFALLFVSALVAFPASAGDVVITPVVLEGDAVLGVGNVTRIDYLGLNDAGGWFVEVDTDFPDADQDGALLRDTGPELREGQAIAGPTPTAVLDSFDSSRLNLSGEASFNLFLDGTTGLSDDSGVYFSSGPGMAPVVVIQESDPAPAATFPMGTWAGFFETRLTDDRRLLVLGTVDTPAGLARGLFLFDLDAAGGITGTTKIAAEADILPGQTEALDDIGTGPHSLAIDQDGVVMFFADLTGSTATDGCIYLGSTLLAQEGSPSPVPGRNWSSLSSPELDVDAEGGWVFSGSLAGDSASNLVIIRNGAVFRQEGDEPPGGVGPGTALTSFGSGPLFINPRGEVLWYGDWDGPTGSDTALFLDDKVLVQEGVTSIGGQTVTALRGIQDGYVMSPDGEFILFEAQLANGVEGAFLIELTPGTWTDEGFGLPGTTGVPLLQGEGAQIAGLPVVVSLTNALPNSFATLIIGLSPSFTGLEGGTLVPFPDIFISPLPTGPAGQIIAGGVWPSGVPAGFQAWYQYWVSDPAGPFGYSASNGLRSDAP